MKKGFRILRNISFLIVLLWLAWIIFLKVSIKHEAYSYDKPHKVQRIYTGSGPEDMALDTLSETPRLLVSCDDRRNAYSFGGIFSIDLKTEISKRMTIIRQPENFSFYPHGIDMAVLDSIPHLFVISHNPSDATQAVAGFEHLIYRFRIQGDTLIWQETLSDPALKAPNDLFATDDGQLYVTNYMAGFGFWHKVNALLFSGKGGSLAHYDGAGNWQIVLHDLQYPNGVLVNEDKLFLSTTTGSQFLEYKIATDGTLSDTPEQQVALTGGDNITLDEHGKLLTTSHPVGLAFMQHAGNSKKHSPIVIYQIDPQNFTTKMLYQNSGKTISAASTAIWWKDALYISQVFEPYVLKVEYFE